MSMTRAIGPIAFALLVLVTGATSIGCTAAAAGKVSTAEMPAPAADPVVSTASGWSDFLTWATSMTDEGTSIMDDFGSDADAQDISGVESDARSLYGWASDARTWLAANPPDACYAAVHASYDRSMSHYQKAGSLLMGGVSASSLTAATGELKTANAAVATTTALVKKVSC